MTYRKKDFVETKVNYSVIISFRPDTENNKQINPAEECEVTKW